MATTYILIYGLPFHSYPHFSLHANQTITISIGSTQSSSSSSSHPNDHIMVPGTHDKEFARTHTLVALTRVIRTVYSRCCCSTGIPCSCCGGGCAAVHLRHVEVLEIKGMNHINFYIYFTLTPLRNSPVICIFIGYKPVVNEWW